MRQLYSQRARIQIVCVATLLLGVSLAAIRSTDTTVKFGVWPHTSTNGVVVTQQTVNTPYVYTYTIHAGDAISDVIPFNVCLDTLTTGDLTTWSDEVAIQNIAGAFSGDVTGSGPWTFTQSSSVSQGGHGNADPGCQAGSLTIAVPSGTLTTIGNNVYTVNVTFTLQNNSNPAGNPKLVDGIETQHIQIQVNVLPADENRITCFMTDSEANLLMTCDGTPVTESGGANGVFAVIANKKGIAVSTNPGQFYYNLLWRNTTGTDQTVDVTMVPTGFVPSGTQAVHWLTFPTAGFGGVTPSDFNDVIAGNPAGSSGTITGIVVPAASTLYVTYHLEWDGLGSPAPNWGACGALTNGTASVAGSVSGSFAATADACTAGATGYRK